ncbi:S-acyltransferase 14 [Gracilariopsis chorda]|uniref:Palmitoyltransferase n=1 Tax=Gracilariopsis chorda TaxID=448386 RepID=A0A2V3IVM8_9FLOR|nr:S-acyltransferase 14 [Gracilariopsis chorda]|eukprot:PXF45190.1 S-acyltransferase 14 [Gracilariopsis chorda]
MPRLSPFLQRYYPKARLARCTKLRVAGFLPVLLVIGLQGLAYFTAVPGTLIPLYSKFPILSVACLILFHFIFVNVVINYFLLVFLDPGSPPEEWHAPPPPTIARMHPRKTDEDEANILLHTQPQEAFQYAHLIKERTYDGLLRYCRFCSAYKPDRSHHCSACRRCILRMDHHCVFVNNCISFYNHKFFIGFVTYAFLGCVQVALVSFPTFIGIISLSASTVSNFRTDHLVTVVRALISVRLSLKSFSVADQLSEPVKTITMIGYITTSAFSFALSVFVAMHFYLTAKGRTTIEMYEITDPARMPFVMQYDLGIANNFKSVCGSRPLYWFFPTRSYIEGDGLSYQRRSDIESAV